MTCFIYLVTTVMVPTTSIKFVAINETLVAFHLLNPSANFDQRIFDRIHDPPCQWQLELRQHMAQTQLANCTFQQEVAQIDITLMLCKFSSLQVPFNCLSSPERNRLCNDPARCSACSNRPLIFVHHRNHDQKMPSREQTIDYDQYTRSVL